jgi:nicotinate-nucleotide--dimethylbenzimidazole phosphoribosyltransferase
MVAQQNTERTEVSPPREVVAPPVSARPVAPPPINLRPAAAPAPAVTRPAAATPPAADARSGTAAPSRPVVPPPIVLRPAVAPPPVPIRPVTPARGAPAAASPPKAAAPVPVTAPGMPPPVAAPAPAATAPAPAPPAAPTAAAAKGGAAAFAATMIATLPGGPAAGSRATVPAVGRATTPAIERAAPQPPAAAHARAPTLLGVATRGSAEGTITAVPITPHVETRVPGAAFTLPANPLSELGNEDLDSFIDCTLFETDAEVEALLSDDSGPTREMHPPEAPTAVNDGAAADARAMDAAAAATGKTAVLRKVAPAPAAGRKAAIISKLLRFDAQVSDQLGKIAPWLPPNVRKVVPRATLALLGCVAAGAIAGLVLRRPPPPAATPRATVAAAAAAGATAAAAPPAAVAPAPNVAEPTAPSVPVAAAPAPAPRAAAPAERPAPADDEDAAPRAAPKPRRAAAVAAGASGDCSARVATEPPDARIFWGDKLIGTSPMAEARVPCGAATVTLRRDRYQPVTREVSAVAGNVAEISQRLHRPSATLSIGSSPPHAEITVNGISQGMTPRRVTVSRFETVTVQVKLAGYAPWKKRLYVRAAETRLGTQLAPAGGKRGGR